MNTVTPQEVGDAKLGELVDAANAALPATLDAETLKAVGLSQGDLPAIAGLAAKIDSRNPISVAEFGRDVAEHTSRYADTLLEQVRSSDLDETGTKLNQVVLAAKSLNLNALSDSRSRIPVIGRFIDSTSSLGAPAEVRYLGTVVDGAGVVTLGRTALKPTGPALDARPVVLAIGTCMHVGKTTTMAKLIEAATAAGVRAGAAKLAGVAALRDLREFADAGAVDVKSFLDCGLPSTVDAEDLAPVFTTVVNALDGDVVLVELGDGIVGHYHVETVLTNPGAMANVAAVVLCAGDIVGAFGAKRCLDDLGVDVTVVSGLATENVAGTAVIESWLGVPAVNGVKHPERLFGIVRDAVSAWTAARSGAVAASSSGKMQIHKEVQP